MGILVVLLLALALGASFFADRIGNAVIREINKGLVEEIKVADYDLTLIKYFPSAAVTLNQVQVPNDKGTGNLLEADELSFRFRLFSLFGSRINISSMVIRDGALVVNIDKKGEPDFDILVESDSGSGGDSETDLNIKLEEALMEDVELIYVDEQSKMDVRINVDRVDMSGEFSDNQFALNSQANFETVFVETPDGRYFAGKRINYDADVDVDLSNEIYKIKSFLLNIEENKFALGGEVKKSGKHFDYDLEFDGKDCTLQSLLELLPEGYVENLVGLKSKGDFTFEGKVKGQSGDHKMPKVDITLGLDDGSITGPQLAKPFKDLTFKANFDNGNDRTLKSSVLKIDRLKGYLGKEIQELSLMVEDFDRPYIEMDYTGTIPFDFITEFLDDDMIKDGKGDIEVSKFRVKGLYEHMMNPSLVYKITSEGEVDFDDISFKSNGEKLLIDKGKFKLRGNDLSVENLTLEGAGSEMEFNGTCNNLLPVLLADSINSKDARLVFNAKLDAEKLDFDKLMALSSVPEKGTVEEELYDSLKTEQLQQREQITQFLDGMFTAQIKSFTYGKIKGQDFNGKLVFRNGELLVDGGLNAMDGTFSLDGIIFFKEKPELKAKLTCQKIDGREFFYQTENFGQDYLTHKNIKGNIDAKIAIDAFWDEKGEFLMDKLHVITDATINDGELIKFAMMDDFSTFVKLEDLRHIRFSKVRNLLEIKNSTLTIPVMLIQNNAINLTLNGEHTFDQDIHYRVKVNVGQTLWNKMFKKPGSKPIRAKNGLLNLYYRIKGTIDEYEMDSDKKGVKRDFEASERKKQLLEQELVQAFGEINALTGINDLEDAPD